MILHYIAPSTGLAFSFSLLHADRDLHSCKMSVIAASKRGSVSMAENRPCAHLNSNHIYERYKGLLFSQLSLRHADYLTSTVILNLLADLCVKWRLRLNTTEPSSCFCSKLARDLYIGKRYRCDDLSLTLCNVVCLTIFNKGTTDHQNSSLYIYIYIIHTPPTHTILHFTFMAFGRCSSSEFINNNCTHYNLVF